MALNTFFGVGNVAIWSGSGPVYTLDHVSSVEYTDSREQQTQKDAAGNPTAVFTGSAENTGTITITSAPIALVGVVCGYTLTETSATSALTTYIQSATGAFADTNTSVATASGAVAGSYVVVSDGTDNSIYRITQDNGVVAQTSASMTEAQAGLTITVSSPAAGDTMTVVVFPETDERGVYTVDTARARPECSVAFNYDSRQSQGEGVQVYIPRVVFGEMPMSAAVDTIAEQALAFTALRDSDIGGVARVSRYRKS